MAFEAGNSGRRNRGREHEGRVSITAIMDRSWTNILWKESGASVDSASASEKGSLAQMGWTEKVAFEGL